LIPSFDISEDYFKGKVHCSGDIEEYEIALPFAIYTIWG